MIPRIRGRSAQGDDGKWYFEISLWNFEGTTQVGEPFGPFGPFETEKAMKQEMRRATELACKSVSGPNGEKPTGFIDMKNGGVFRDFESKEN